VTSQFLSVDPLVNVTETPYAYTGGDPVNESDPIGLGVTDPGFVAQVKRQEQQLPEPSSVNCGPNFDQTGICPGHPEDDFDSGPSIFEHLTIGWGGCLVLCLNVQFQGGAVSVSWGGFGLLDKGPYVGWANKPFACRQGNQAWVGGGTGLGASISGGLNNKNQRNRGVPSDWEFDVGPYVGFGGGEMSTHTWKLF